MNKEQLGEMILRERKNQKLSQKKLAEKAGFSRYQVILEVEQSYVDYGISVLLKILDALGLSLTFIPIQSNGKHHLNGKATTKQVAEIIKPPGGPFDFSKVEAAKEEQIQKIEKKKPPATKKVVSTIWKR